MASLPRSLGALEERSFRLLWLGQTASALGDALIPVALAFAVLDLTDSAASLGLVLASFAVFRVAFMLVGGVWADRLPRRAVMIACDWVRAVVEAFTAFVLITDHAELWMLVVTASAFGTASAFFGPASTGLIPATVSAGRLQQANALISLSQSSANIFGPALSGLLVATVGAGWVFAIDSVSFVASAGFLLAMRVPGRSRAVAGRFLADLARGWREVTSRTWLWASFLTFSVSNLAVAVFFVLGPFVARDELGGASDWGLVLTGGAIGGVFGSALALRIRPRRPLLWVFGVVAPVSLQLAFLAPPLPVPAIAAAAGIAMGGIAMSNAVWHTALQQHIPGDVLSRVSSYDWMISLVFMPLGFALAGPVADALGVQTTLWAAAALLLTANLAVLALPSVRGLTTLPIEPLPGAPVLEPEPLAAPTAGLGPVRPVADPTGDLRTTPAQ